MTKKPFRNILAIPLFIGVALLLFTSCPNTITPPDPTGTGYFDVDLVITGSIDGEPYFQEISFSDSTRTVALDVSYKLDSVDIQSTKEVSGASLKVNGRSIDYGNLVAVALETGTNTILVKVTPDLVDAFDYTLKLKRGVAPGETLSNDATLSSLVIKDLTNPQLTPVFSPDVFEYTKTIPYNYTDATIIAESNDENADITINGTAVDSGDEVGPYSIAEGDSLSIEIIVTAEDETTKKEYSLTITRASEPDTVKPTITLNGPNPFPVEVYSVWEEEEPGYSASDNIDGDITSSVDVFVDIDTNLITSDGGGGQVIYNVSDISGNPAIPKIRNVIVQDTTSPVITINVENNPMHVDLDGDFTIPTATITDNYYAESDIIKGISGSVDTHTNGSYEIIYTAEDSAPLPNSSSVKLTVVVSDDSIPPVITLEGENPYYIDVFSAWSDPGVSAEDNINGDISNMVETTYYRVNPDDTLTEIDEIDMTVVGEYLEEYDVQDSSANPAETKSRTVFVRDIVPPVISISGADPLIIDYGSTFTEEDAIDNVAVSDTYDDSKGIEISISSDIDAVNTGILGDFTISYDAADSSGNPATQLECIVRVADRIDPEITIEGENPATVECGDAYTDTDGAEATDNYPAAVTITPTYNNVDTSTPGTYYIEYTAEDYSGNTATATRTVEVVDTTPPEIFLDYETDSSEVITVLVNDNWNDYEPGYTATDIADGNITGSVAVEVDTSSLNTDSVKYTVSDNEGNTTTVYRNIEVVDETAPVITIDGDYSLPGDNSLEVDYRSNFVAPDATATDNYDAPFEGEIFITGDDLVVTTGVELGDTYEVLYSTSDSSGNTGTATLTVVIADLSGPEISIIGGDETVECGESYEDAGATGTDNYDTSVTVTTENLVNTSVVGTYTVTYSAQDSEGNAAETATRTVEVVDTTAPEITLTYETDSSEIITVQANTSWSSKEPGYSAYDIADGTLTSSVVVSVDTTVLGPGSVTYTVIDDAGHETTVSRAIVVVDTTPPDITIEGVNPLEIDYGSVFVPPGASASDTHDIPFTGIITVEDDDLVETSGIGVELGDTYEVLYTTADSSGNTASATLYVVIADLSGPTIVLNNGPQGIPTITINAGDSFTDPGATVTDNYDSGTTTIYGSGSVYRFIPGTYTLTYFAGDTHSNTTTVTRTVIVQ